MEVPNFCTCVSDREANCLLGRTLLVPLGTAVLLVRRRRQHNIYYYGTSESRRVSVSLAINYYSGFQYAVQTKQYSMAVLNLVRRTSTGA